MVKNLSLSVDENCLFTQLTLFSVWGSLVDGYNDHQLLCIPTSLSNSTEKERLSFLIVLSDGSGIKSCWPCLGHKPSPGPTTVAREMKCLDWPGLDDVLTSRTWEWDRPYMNHKWGWVFAQKGMSFFY